MNTVELIKKLLDRIKKFSWVILSMGVLAAGFFYYLAKQNIAIFIAKSTVFPLSSNSDNSVSGSTIGNLLGIADAPKSFTADASINIVELATSRRTREAVAMARLPQFANKTIAELLIAENNKHTGFMQYVPIKPPKDSLALVNTASAMLRGAFTAKVGKNGILELTFQNSSPDLAKEVSYVYIDKLSEFYIDLKKKKAQIDFEFAVQKADSLKRVLDFLDARAVALDEKTFFTDEQLKRYSIPKVNLGLEKQTVQSQYYYAINNRESAAYKLQKETPIIEPLDKPEPPFDVIQKSKMMYALIGGLLGMFLGLIVVSWKVVSNYLGNELNKAIEKATKTKETKDSPNEIVEAVPQIEPLK
jgi:uncharacterized protein involved in exopolysaccharide biosynthesis